MKAKRAGSHALRVTQGLSVSSSLTNGTVRGEP